MISINDLQKLLGKKSKEQASGAISKLSADEWNTLVQGVIQHYGLLALDAETNTVTIRDSSGNAHTYELTPYEELSWEEPILTLPIKGSINGTFYNLTTIPATGGNLTITFSYTQTNKKGGSFSSGGSISYTDFESNPQVIPNNGNSLTIKIDPNSDTSTKTYTISNIVVTRESKSSEEKTLTITQNAYDPEADIDKLIINVVGKTEEQAEEIFNGVNENTISNYIQSSIFDTGTKYKNITQDDGSSSSHSDEIPVEWNIDNDCKLICILTRHPSSFKYQSNALVGNDFDISDFGSTKLNIPYIYNDLEYYCSLVFSFGDDSSIKLIVKNNNN